MKALLIVAHGSRKNPPNKEIATLAHALNDRAAERFAMVRHAFIQFAEPLFETQIDDMVDQGVTRVVVVPYFIAAGSHVQNDIPALIAEAKTRHPGLDMELTTHFGNFPGVPDVILSEV